MNLIFANTNLNLINSMLKLIIKPILVVVFLFAINSTHAQKKDANQPCTYKYKCDSCANDVFAKHYSIKIKGLRKGLAKKVFGLYRSNIKGKLYFSKDSIDLYMRNICIFRKYKLDKVAIVKLDYSRSYYMLCLDYVPFKNKRKVK